MPIQPRIISADAPKSKNYHQDSLDKELEIQARCRRASSIDDPNLRKPVPGNEEDSKERTEPKVGAGVIMINKDYIPKKVLNTSVKLHQRKIQQ